MKLIKAFTLKWLGMIVLPLIFMCSNQELVSSELSSPELANLELGVLDTTISELSSPERESPVLNSHLTDSHLTESTAAKGKRKAGLDLGVVSGASVVDLDGESYGAKAMPVVGISLFPWAQIIDSLNLGAEISIQYTFRSDYSNYYYYDSFGTFGFVPNLHLLFGGSSVRFILLFGAGLGYSFSDRISLSYPIGCAGAGVRFKSGLISSILLTYSHSFVQSFQSFESVRLSANIRLFNSEGE